MKKYEFMYTEDADMQDLSVFGLQGWYIVWVLPDYNGSLFKAFFQRKIVKKVVDDV